MHTYITYSVVRYISREHKFEVLLMSPAFTCYCSNKSYSLSQYSDHHWTENFTQYGELY